MPQDELHPAMAQSAMPVIEDNLSLLCNSRHTRNYYIAQICTPVGFPLNVLTGKRSNVR